jgi:hypothetical protein
MEGGSSSKLRSQGQTLTAVFLTARSNRCVSSFGKSLVRLGRVFSKRRSSEDGAFRFSAAEESGSTFDL